MLKDFSRDLRSMPRIEEADADSTATLAIPAPAVCIELRATITGQNHGRTVSRCCKYMRVQLH